MMSSAAINLPFAVNIILTTTPIFVFQYPKNTIQLSSEIQALTAMPTTEK